MDEKSILLSLIALKDQIIKSEEINIRDIRVELISELEYCKNIIEKKLDNTPERYKRIADLGLTAVKEIEDYNSALAEEIYKIVFFIKKHIWKI